LVEQQNYDRADCSARARSLRLRSFCRVARAILVFDFPEIGHLLPLRHYAHLPGFQAKFAPTEVGERARFHIGYASNDFGYGVLIS